MWLASSSAARADAALDAAGYESHRVGCLFGSSLGGLDMVHETVTGFNDAGLRGVSPFLLPGALNNMAAGMMAIDANIHGPCYAVTAAWASSTLAIGQAFEMVRRGAVDAMLAGGSESLLEAPLATALLGRSGLFADVAESSENAAQASKPFDARRRGLVAAEGAVMLVIESLERALARGARPYAEVIGYASAFAPTATRQRSGWQGMMVHAMQGALRSASLEPREVQYIHAYGSASRATDAMETQAIKEVFGANARDLWLSSTKGACGHMLGASGAFETAITSLALRQGVIPPTAHLSTPDPACDLDYVPGTARQRQLDVAMLNTFGESGHCGSLLLQGAA